MKKNIYSLIIVIVFFHIASVFFYPPIVFAASGLCTQGHYQKIGATEKCISNPALTHGESGFGWGDWCSEHGLGATLAVRDGQYCCCEYDKCDSRPDMVDTGSSCASSGIIQNQIIQCKNKGGRPVTNQPTQYPYSNPEIVCGKNPATGDDYGVLDYMSGTMDATGKIIVNNVCCNKETTAPPSAVPSAPSVPKGTLLLQIPIGNKTSIRLCLNDKDSLTCGGIGDYIILVYAWVIGAVGILSMATFAYAGLLWLLSRGDSGKVTFAKKVLTDTIAGLVLALGSYLILFIINPNLVDFQPLFLKKIAPLDEDVGPGAPPTNVTVDSKDIEINLYDHGEVDGDIIRVTLNGNVIINKLVLKGPPGDKYIFHLQDGVNKFEVYAYNEGTSEPNTTTMEFTNIISGPEKQSWGIKTDKTTAITITVAGGKEDAPLMPPP